MLTSATILSARKKDNTRTDYQSPEGELAKKRNKAGPTEAAVGETVPCTPMMKVDNPGLYDECPFFFFDNLSEEDVNGYRKSCMDALEKGHIYTAENQFKHLAYLNDEIGVRAILSHPVAKSAVFQRSRDLGLLEGIRAMNVQMVELLLSSGASPATEYGTDNATTAIESIESNRYAIKSSTDREVLLRIKSLIHSSLAEYRGI